MELLIFLAFLVGTLPGYSPAQTSLAIPDSGWHLWLDRQAQWEKDTLYLPDDAHIERLPVNPPSGGWERLHAVDGITVTLPSTVEEHFWGVNGFRPYRDEEYAYETEDSVVRNGNYLGVSWWVRDIEVPKSFRGKNVTLFVRGARLRAEVYLNHKLVGYNIINEVSFTCDATGAIRPGERNQLAIRITNPGGRLDWVDTRLMQWGESSFQKSHGFGGLDRGLRLSAHDPVYLSDVWVQNTPDLHQIRACGTVSNISGKALDVKVTFSVLSPTIRGKVCATVVTPVHVLPGSSVNVTIPVNCPTAQQWTLERPRLYQLKATMSSAGAKRRFSDSRQVEFGFRWFEATGIGKNAVLRLNGQRTRLLSAISWGFWGHNGLWPTKDLAEREVRAARALGMNCIQFHRNIGKAEVFDAQDRIGLLRYTEPGGGQTAFGDKFSLYAPSPTGPIDDSGRNGEPKTFAERYMEEKIVRMVRDHRSHPSLVLYTVQNEIHPDLRNPRIFHVLRRVHAEDPSRIVVLKSGFPENTPVNEAWMRPYDDSVYADRGNGYCGWWDAHTVGGPGVWNDSMYTSPTEFTHRSTNDREIVVWGEMLGSPSPDNHAAMVRELRATGGKSYDLKDHEEILGAYERFLDHYGFRGAFPTADALFQSIGSRSYDFWGRVIETARLSESNDYFVMSGWESTAIENHSGLVDNLRNFKGDPLLLAQRTAELRPVIKVHSLVVEKDSSVVLDLFLLNESHRRHGSTMRVWVKAPQEGRTLLGTWNIPPYTEDVFVYPVVTGIATARFTAEGKATLTAEVEGESAVSSTEEVLVVDPRAQTVPPLKIGVISAHPSLQKPFEILPGIMTEPYRRDTKYDLLVAANRFVTPPQGAAEPDREIKGTDDPELYRSAHYGSPENFDYVFSGLHRGNIAVTLKFAEIFRDAPGIRVFDMAINGVTVLKDFDVFKAAGGKNIAIDTNFIVSAPEGMVRITVPRVAVGSARINAMKIDDGETVVAVRCGGRPYRDKSGLLWRDYMPPAGLDEEVLAAVRGGTPLLILSEGQASTASYGTSLSDAGALHYLGYVGEARAPWMGSWYFVRNHPVFSGLPVDCAMGSDYQVGVENSGGIMVDGPGVDVFVGYSRDHDRNIGAGSFSAALGKGKILFHCVPGVFSRLSGTPVGMHPVMLHRLMANSLRYLLEESAGKH